MSLPVRFEVLRRAGAMIAEASRGDNGPTETVRQASSASHAGVQTGEGTDLRRANVREGAVAWRNARRDYLGVAWRNSNTRPEITAIKMRAEVNATIRHFRSLRTESWNLYMLDLRR